jgi:hypothetical protein
MLTHRSRVSSHDVTEYVVYLYKSDGSNVTPRASDKRWTGYDDEQSVFYQVDSQGWLAVLLSLIGDSHIEPGRVPQRQLALPDPDGSPPQHSPTLETYLRDAASSIIVRRSPPAQYSRMMNRSFWSSPMP